MRAGGRIMVSIAVGTAIATGGCGSLIVTQRTPERLRAHDGFEWIARSSAGVRVHAERGAEAAAELDRIAREAVDARAAAARYVGEPDGALIEVFVLDTRDRMEDLIGRRTNGTGYYASGAVCVVWPRTGPPGLRHEMAHVVAMRSWGVPERWVNEGVAVDATGDWKGHDLDAVCRVLMERGELVGLGDLTRRFERLPSALSYPAAGSFVRHVREAHGRDAIVGVWEGGADALALETGMTLDELEAAWMDRVRGAGTEGVTYDPRSVTPVDG